MDRSARRGRGPVLQVLVSGVAFGGLHFYAFAGIGAALAAQVITTLLGFALAVVYLIANRSLWPSILAHSLNDAVIEPALLRSFIR